MPATQNEKLRVLALYGNAIVDPGFLDSWLANPIAAATGVLGPLSPYEEEAFGRLTQLNPQEKDEIKNLYAQMQSRVDCPRPPCPEPLAKYPLV